MEDRVTVQSGDHMTVARAWVRSEFPAGGVVWVLGKWLVWEGNLWTAVGVEAMEGKAWRWLDRVRVESQKDGVITLKPYCPTKDKVMNVMDALKSICRLDVKRLPVWVVDGEVADPGEVIAFEDVLVRVTAEGPVVVGPRTMDWVGTVVVPCKWNPEAVCPLWEKTVEEWENGDKGWSELCARWFGYFLMNTRKYQRMMVGFGKIRGGKGTKVRIMSALQPGAVMSTSLETLAGAFGADGLDSAKAVVVTEFGELARNQMETVSGMVKRVIGGDPLPINVKYQRGFEAVSPALIMMFGNEVPRLSNKGSGLSGKTLMLPYSKSFVGREDFDLGDKLEKELPGIARWAVEGACRLVAAPTHEKWPVTQGGVEADRKFRFANNPADSFLEEGFRKNSEGFVSMDVLWESFLEWKTREDVRVRVSRNQFPGWIQSEGTWDVWSKRNGSGGVRGLGGLSVRVRGG